MPPGVDFSGLSRRRFLRWSLAAVGSLGAGGTALLLILRGHAPAVPGLQVLNAHQYRTLHALASALFPRGGAFRTGADDLDLARRVDHFLAGEPPWNQRDLRRALLYLEYGPLLVDRELTTFSHLPECDRLKHFNSGWARSDDPLRRQVAVAFRKLLTLLFYDRAEVWPSIGYPGPSAARTRVP